MTTVCQQYSEKFSEIIFGKVSICYALKKGLSGDSPGEKRRANKSIAA